LPQTAIMLLKIATYLFEVFLTLTSEAAISADFDFETFDVRCGCFVIG